MTFLKVLKVHVEYCGRVIMVYKYNGSVVDVDGRCKVCGSGLVVCDV